MLKRAINGGDVKLCVNFLNYAEIFDAEKF